jgi:predicted Zn-dependent peptidase
VGGRSSPGHCVDYLLVEARVGVGGSAVDQQTRTSILPNGLRVATCTVPHARSLAAVLRLAAGARHDPAGKAGLAHLVEHAAASGSVAHPSSRALAGLVERVGGWTDAATEAEATVYRAGVPARHADRALAVLAETALRPLLTDAIVAHEREVIRHELADGVDDAGRADELAARALWGDHPLAADPAGTADSVARLTAEDVRGFAATAYTAPAAVLAVVGPLPHDAALALAEAAFAAMPAGPGRPAGPTPVVRPPGRGLRLARTDAAQVQVRLVFPGLAAGDPDEPASWVLDALLGGPRAAGRVFDRLREQLGLAYEAGTAAESYSDAGVYTVHAAVAPGAVVRAVEAIAAEVAAVHAGVADAEVAEAIEYMVGWNEMAADGFDGFADGMAEDLQLRGHPRTLSDVAAALSAVTTAVVRRVSARVLDPAGARLVLVGPVDAVDADALLRAAGILAADAPRVRRIARRAARPLGRS